MSPAEFEYLIRKTLTYLEFHSDDSAKELAAEWGKILKEIRAIKKKENHQNSRFRHTKIARIKLTLSPFTNTQSPFYSP